jgi:hypothetical protein
MGYAHFDPSVDSEHLQSYLNKLIRIATKTLGVV